MKSKRIMFLIMTMVMVLGTGVSVYAATTYQSSKTVASKKSQYKFTTQLTYISSIGKDEGISYVVLSGEDKEYVSLKYDIYTRRYIDGTKKLEELISDRRIGTYKYGYKQKIDNLKFKDAESLRCSVKIDDKEHYFSVANKKYKYE